MILNRFKSLINPNYLKLARNITNGSIQIQPELDLGYLCNESNFDEIQTNIAKRKGIGDINVVTTLNKQLNSTDKDNPNYQSIRKNFEQELLKIPNKTHQSVINYGNDPIIIKTIGQKRQFDSKPLEFDEITRRLKLIRTQHLGNLSGSRSYYILGEMAELEQALINYIVRFLLKNNFELIQVPDILDRDIIESCGMNTRGVRTQVYSLDEKLHGPDHCLSGTSEIALAGYLMNKTIPLEQLPINLVAVSRCYRAETSSIAEERGIYRVHEFTKVEMFIVSEPEKSDETLEEIRTIQENYFKSLGIHFNVLDMPPHELGAQAYRKYDIEAWLAGRQLYGEISSCSNCTDYQSRRLGIKYESKDGIRFVHTLNGTACAIPRLLIALIEDGQNPKGAVTVPEVLWEFMNCKTKIGIQKRIPDLKLMKSRKLVS